MVKSLILILYISLLFPPNGLGQCGQELLKKKNLEYFDDLTPSAYLKTKSLGKVSLENIPTEIEVVFHILYNNNEELLDDSLINSQIVALNEAFFLCSDTVRAIFKDSRGCPKMIFKLATFDPNGKRTNGILKKYTSNKTFYKNDSLFVLDHPKFAKFGGSNAWESKEVYQYMVLQPGTT